MKWATYGEFRRGDTVVDYAPVVAVYAVTYGVPAVLVFLVGRRLWRRIDNPLGKSVARSFLAAAAFTPTLYPFGDGALLTTALAGMLCLLVSGDYRVALQVGVIPLLLLAGVLLVADTLKRMWKGDETQQSEVAAPEHDRADQASRRLTMGSIRERLATSCWQSVTSFVVCSTYCGATAFLLTRQGGVDIAAAFAVVGGAIGAVLSRFSAGRNLLKVLAGLELAVAVLAFRIFVRRHFDAEAMGYYLALGVVLPALVLAFAGVRKSEPFEENLPPGYEHVSRSSQPLPAWQKLGLVALAPFLLVVQMYSAVLFVSILVLPAAFAIYYLIRILGTRKPSTPQVARRLAVPSQRERPAQTQSYLTVNPNDGRDDNA